MLVPSRGLPAAQNLRRLVLLRYFVLAVLVAAATFAVRTLHLDVPVEPVAAAVGFLALLNFGTHLRLRFPWPITGAEILVNLAAEAIALTVLLYFTGGSTNPLVSLYLLPLIVAAAVLPRAHTWAVAALTVACYTLLIFWFEPLESFHDHEHGGGVFNIHIVGMWLTFALSAGLISHFVVSMAQSLRERDRLLAAAREEALRNERIVALGTLAAGAAHELGTPLGTMALLVEEMERTGGARPDSVEDLAELKAQIGNCKRIIGEMVAAAGGARAEGGSLQPADEFLGDVLDKWQLMRPQARFTYRWSGEAPAPDLVTEQTISQALINLLNNAADASPDSVEVEGGCRDGRLFVEILDRGPGLTAEIQTRAAEPFFTTKAPGSGLGIGLFLANATIERCGGTVRLFNREGGGACTEVILPLAGASG